MRDFIFLKQSQVTAECVPVVPAPVPVVRSKTCQCTQASAATGTGTASRRPLPEAPRCTQAGSQAQAGMRIILDANLNALPVALWHVLCHSGCQ